MKRAFMLLLAGGIALGLAGCGRKGAPEAPGPGNKIIYPHTYPSE